MKKTPHHLLAKKPPLLVGVIATARGLPLITRPRLPCDIIELRLDLLLQEGATVADIENTLLQKKHPTLLTARHPAEGGARPWQRGERASLLRRLLPHAELLDIELASLRELQSLRSQFPKTPLILSAHFFDHTPPDDELASLLERMVAKKPDMIKVSCRCNSSADLGRLAVLQHLNRELPLALMGMGELGRISRTMLPLLGARLVYGWLDKPTAPGQPSVVEIRKQIA